ncbi:MAG: electron transfer flavoprotein subunit beta/FixA family protein [Nanoarchaeota archaeon]|nr:electron transfer flavoprotein subunit beta/FixA family protein [Nanoarchaeota archaeon]
MDLVVLIKQVPDPEKNAGMKEDGTLNREESQNIVNPYDMNALEEALSMKDKYGGKVTVISMGLPKAEQALREALARGADEAILLTDRKLGASDTLATAYALSQAIKKLEKYDLVFCGMQAIDGDTAQVGPQVAERLDIPQITYAEKIEIKDKELIAKRIVEGGYEIIKSSYPALVTVTNTANEPRLGTLLNIKKAHKKEIPHWDAAHIEADEKKIGKEGSPTKVRKIEKPEQKGKGIMFEGKLEEIIPKFLEQIKTDKLILKKGVA